MATEIPEAEAWDFELSDLQNPIIYKVEDYATFLGAIDAASEMPSAHHLIEITVNDWRGSGDLLISQNRIFHAAGGILALTTENREMLLMDSRILFSSQLSGWGWFHLKSTHTEDQYQLQNGLTRNSANFATIRLNNGKRVLADIELGTFDQDNYELMRCAVGIYASSSDETSSTMLKRFKFRGNCSDWRLRGPQIWNIKDGFADAQFEDSFYVNMNYGATIDKNFRLWRCGH